MFRIGCDPEFILMNEMMVPQSALRMTEARKYRPIPLSCGAFLADNVNLEVNTKPADSVDEFCDTFQKVITETGSYFPDLTIHAIASIEYPKEVCKDREAKEFGCDPDYNAHKWNGEFVKANKVAKSAAKKPLRSTGGHIHIGRNSPEVNKLLSTVEGGLSLVVAMDFFAGLPLVYLDSDPSAPDRRKLYGLAGSHRPQDHGIEYRALSSFWTRHPDLTKFVYLATKSAVQSAIQDTVSIILKKVGSKTIQHAINKSDKELCRDIYLNEVAQYCDPSVVEMAEELRNRDFRSDVLEAWRV
jgi:hypothetical protein